MNEALVDEINQLDFGELIEMEVSTQIRNALQSFGEILVNRSRNKMQFQLTA